MKIDILLLNKEQHNVRGHRTISLMSHVINNVMTMTMTMIFISLRPLAEYERSFSLQYILVEHLVTIHDIYCIKQIYSM